MLREELTLLHGLQFDLIVHNPYKSLQGIGFLLEDACIDPCKSMKFETFTVSVMRRARHAIDSILTTDAPLLYAPGLIALASFRAGLIEELEGDKDKTWQIFNRVLITLQDETNRRNSSNNSSVKTNQEISQNSPYVLDMTSIDEIENYLKEGRRTIDQVKVREIDKQLKKCRNPLSNKDSDMYKKVHATRDKVK